MTKNIFLFGFSKNTDEIVYRILSKRYNICYRISEHKDADDIWAYIRVDFEAISPYLEDYKNYGEFYKQHFQHYLLLVQRRGEFWRDYFEIRNEFSILYNQFSKILRESSPDVIIFSNIPHEGADYILYSLAKKWNIKTLIFYQSLFANKFFAMTNLQDFGYFTTVPSIENTITNDFSLEKLDLFYMKDVLKNQEIKRGNIIYYVFLRIYSIVRSFFVSVFRIFSFKKKRYWIKSILKNIDLALNNLYYFWRYKKNIINEGELEELLCDNKTIYAPLHLQPELTTSALGGIYEDQLTMIDEIVSEVGSEYKILVKENPKQNGFQRRKLFFERLMSHNNVKLIANDVSSALLVEHSILLVTVSGTAGWEALQMGKKCMVFGQAWYQNLPGCYSQKKSTLSDVLDAPMPSKDKIIISCKKLLDKCLVGVVDDSYSILVDNFNANDNANLIAENIVKLLDSSDVLW